MSTFLFNFKKQFAPLVESGQKRQTVRANRKDGRLPRVGDTAKCFTGLRTRGARLLIAAPVIEVSRVLIDFKECTLATDRGRLGMKESQEFARDDGFRSFGDMLEWFRSNHKEAALFEPHLFEGFVTKWQPPP